MLSYRILYEPCDHMTDHMTHAVTWVHLGADDIVQAKPDPTSRVATKCADDTLLLLPSCFEACGMAMPPQMQAALEDILFCRRNQIRFDNMRKKKDSQVHVPAGSARDLMEQVCGCFKDLYVGCRRWLWQQLMLVDLRRMRGAMEPCMPAPPARPFVSLSKCVSFCLSAIKHIDTRHSLVADSAAGPTRPLHF